jgi:hypothetical protein
MRRSEKLHFWYNTKVEWSVFEANGCISAYFGIKEYERHG